MEQRDHDIDFNQDTDFRYPEMNSLRSRNHRIDSIHTKNIGNNKDLNPNIANSQRERPDVWNLSPTTAEKVLVAFSQYIRENRRGRFRNSGKEYIEGDNVESFYREHVAREPENENNVFSDGDGEEINENDYKVISRQYDSGDPDSEESCGDSVGGETSEVSMSGKDLLNSEVQATSESISDEEKLAILTALARKKQNLQQNAVTHTHDPEAGLLIQSVGTEQSVKLSENRTESKLSPSRILGRSRIPVRIGSFNVAPRAIKNKDEHGVNDLAPQSVEQPTEDHNDFDNDSTLSVNTSQKKTKRIAWSLKSNDDKNISTRSIHNSSDDRTELVAKVNCNQSVLNNPKKTLKRKPPVSKSFSIKERDESSLTMRKDHPNTFTRSRDRNNIIYKERMVKSDELISIPSISAHFVEMSHGDDNNIFELIPQLKEVSSCGPPDEAIHQKKKNSRRSKSTVSQGQRNELDCSSTLTRSKIQSHNLREQNEEKKGRTARFTKHVDQVTGDEKFVKGAFYSTNLDFTPSDKTKNHALIDLDSRNQRTVDILKHFLCDIEQNSSKYNYYNEFQSPNKPRRKTAKGTPVLHSRRPAKSNITLQTAKSTGSFEGGDTHLTTNDEIRQNIKSKVRRLLNSLQSNVPSIHIEKSSCSQPKSAPTTLRVGKLLHGSQDSLPENKLTSENSVNRNRHHKDSTKKSAQEDPVHTSRLLRDVNPRYRYLYSIGTPHETGPPSPSSFPDLLNSSKSATKCQSALSKPQKQPSLKSTSLSINNANNRTPRQVARPKIKIEAADKSDYESCSEHEIQKCTENRDTKREDYFVPITTPSQYCSQKGYNNHYQSFQETPSYIRNRSFMLAQSHEKLSLRETISSLWPSIKKILKTVLFVYFGAWVLVMIVLLF